MLSTREARAAQLLGDFRPVVADLLWLRANGLWERRERARVLGALRAVVAVDPRPLSFWLNGARMMAYDLPGWRMAELRGHGTVPSAVEDHIRHEQAELALAWLDRASAFHPESPAILIERANICLYAARDSVRAAEYYRRAAELPRAPAYVGRLHARLLRGLGRRTEALTWLKRFYAQRSARGSADERELLRWDIRELEDELQVPPGDRLQDESGNPIPAAGIGL